MKTDYKFTDLPPQAQKHLRIFQIQQILNSGRGGLMGVVLVLMLQDRQLDLFEISILFAIFSGSAMLLELPLGGLADGIGRKPVYIMGIWVFIISLLGLILFEGFWLTAIFMTVMGMGVALLSGTMNAWFIEEFKAFAPDFGTQPALAKIQFTMGVSLAVFSVLGGGLVDFFADNFIEFGIKAYEIPLVASVILAIVSIIYTQIWVVESHRKLNLDSIKNGFSSLPNLLRDSGFYAVKHKIISLLLISSGLTSVTVFTVQALWTPFAKPLIEGDYAVTLIGVFTFFYFFCMGLGSKLSTPMIKFYKGNEAKAIQTFIIFAVISLVILATSSNLVQFIVGFILFALFVGAQISPNMAIFHHHIPDQKRSTLLSLQSLIGRFGGVIGLLLLGYISENYSISTAWLYGGLFSVAACLLYFILSKRIHNISNH